MTTTQQLVIILKPTARRWTSVMLRRSSPAGTAIDLGVLGSWPVEKPSLHRENQWKPWLVGGLVAIFYFPIYWECHTIPTDEVVYFSEGWPWPTNQMNIPMWNHPFDTSWYTISPWIIIIFSARFHRNAFRHDDPHWISIPNCWERGRRAHR